MFTTSSSVFISQNVQSCSWHSWDHYRLSNARQQFCDKGFIVFCHKQLTLFPMVTISTAMLIHDLSCHLPFHALCYKWRQRLTSCHWKQSQLPVICWAQLFSHETLVTNIFFAPPYTTDNIVVKMSYTKTSYKTRQFNHQKLDLSLTITPHYTFTSEAVNFLLGPPNITTLAVIILSKVISSLFLK